MRQLINRIPDADVLLSLQPEELAGEILALLHHRCGVNGTERRHEFHRDNCLLELRERNGPTYPDAKQEGIELAYVEAWSWLENQGLIVQKPGNSPWQVLSRRGKALVDGGRFDDFRKAKDFPRHLVHHSIADQVWVSYMRGDYATAVFQAMRAVEVAVRTAAGFPEGEHGVPMIRRAFHKDTGPLTDPTTQEAEREALMALFAGAIGSYKNPHSHRHVPMDDPAEAAEIILLATHLLRIVETRSRRQ